MELARYAIQKLTNIRQNFAAIRKETVDLLVK